MAWDLKYPNVPHSQSGGGCMCVVSFEPLCCFLFMPTSSPITYMQIICINKIDFYGNMMSAKPGVINITQRWTKKSLFTLLLRGQTRCWDFGEALIQDLTRSQEPLMSARLVSKARHKTHYLCLQWWSCGNIMVTSGIAFSLNRQKRTIKGEQCSLFPVRVTLGSGG